MSLVDSEPLEKGVQHAKLPDLRSKWDTAQRWKPKLFDVTVNTAFQARRNVWGTIENRAVDKA